MNETQLEKAEFDEIQVPAGEQITDAAKLAAQEAVQRKTKVSFTFNGVWVPVYPGDSCTTICERYDKRFGARKEHMKQKKMRAAFDRWMDNPLSNDTLADLFDAIHKYRSYKDGNN